jgi:DNA-binding GntR family transcriptional regulator
MSKSTAMVTSSTSGRHRTLAEHAVAELQEAILTGQLAPGTPLRLARLAERLDMSPMPVREAIRQLERLGLAEHVPHRGARVSALSLGDLHETYDARLALEGLAVRRAAARFTDDDRDRCASLLDDHVRGYRGGDERRTRELHAAFHFSLYAASGSQWLVRLIRPLWENSERYRVASLYERRSLERRRREHERLLDACVARDADAAEAALRDHLVQTANTVARRMGHGSLFADAG